MQVNPFVVEILLPFKTKPNSTDEAALLLTDLLIMIENRPLRLSEKRLIQKDVFPYIKSNGISSDNPICIDIISRLSYEYFPTVSKSLLSLQKLKTKDSDEIKIRAVSAEGSLDNIGLVPIVETNLLTNNSPEKKLFQCTLHRHKSTLWTSYRLFINELRECHDNKKVIKHFEEPAWLLGARKLKSGISSIIYVFSSPDSHTWKEKVALGRMSKLAGSKYLATSNLKTHAVISVKSNSMDKLIHIKVLNVTSQSESCLEEVAITQLIHLMDDFEHGKLSADSIRSNSFESLVPEGSYQEIQLLRSALPRRQSGAGSKGLHTITFAPGFRVQAPSRKNIVVDTVAVMNSPNYTMDDPSSVPRFQVNHTYKMP